MAGQDTAHLDAALKTVYGPDMVDLINKATPALDRFEEAKDVEWMGKVYEYPIKIGRTQGVGAYSEGGAIPTAGRVKTAPVRVPVRYNGGRITLTAQAIEVSESSRGAWVPALKLEMDDLIDNLRNDRARAIWGDGRGVFCLVNDATPNGSATVGVDAPGGFAGAVNGARFLNEGMIMGAVNPATGTLRAGIRTVQTVASDGTSVTFDSAPGVWADNDYLVRVASTSVTDVSDSSYQKEPMGLSGLVDDGTNVATLHGVNRTTVPLWASTVIGSVGPWSADVVQRAIDVARQVGGGNIAELWMHDSTRRTYVNSMESDRRYMGADLMRPDGGTAAAKGGRITFGGLPIYEDRFCPYGSVFLLDPSGMERYVLQKGKWEDRDGSVLTRVGTGSGAQHAFEGFFYIWDNFGCRYPNRCARLDGISTSIAVAHIY